MKDSIFGPRGEMTAGRPAVKGPPSPAAIRKRIADSKAAAGRLTAIGQKVIVTKDDGSEVESVVEFLPWELGHGGWVVGVNGISGGYCTRRVRPA